MGLDTANPIYDGREPRWLRQLGLSIYKAQELGTLFPPLSFRRYDERREGGF